MLTEKINPRFTVLLVMIIGVAAMRIPNAAQLTIWANFTPIGAMGLFGGAYFNSKWKAYVFPLLTLLISDLIINLFIFDGKYGVMYGGWYIIYGIFALIVFIGKILIKKVTIHRIILASVIAGLSHWLITDFTVWIGGGIDVRTMLPLTKNWAGLLQCYAQGFPFMKNFMLGNFVYCTILFGAFQFAQWRYPVLKMQII